MFGMTRILPTATASSVRGVRNVVLLHTHIKKKRCAIADVLGKFSPLIADCWIYRTPTRFLHNISCPSPPKITGRIPVHSFLLNKNLAAKLGTVTREGCNGNYIWMKIISGKLQIRQYIESPRQKTTQNPVNRAIKEIGITTHIKSSESYHHHSAKRVSKIGQQCLVN